MSVYAVSDLHGDYSLWKQIKEFLKPEDTLYVLGDCADRGKNGWQIITEVYKHPQCVYVKGNHEDLLVDAIRAYLRLEPEERSVYYRYLPEYQLLSNNGGDKTFRDWRKAPENMKWMTRLDKLPTEVTYESPKGHSVILTHAGFTPDWGKKDLLWSRDHFNDPWQDSYENIYIVHGHTPVPHLLEELGEWDATVIPGYYKYCDGHKYDIDCGTAFTGCTTLIDLDTFEQHIFMNDICVYREDEDNE